MRSTLHRLAGPLLGCLLLAGSVQAADLAALLQAARSHDPQFLAAAAQNEAGQQQSRQGLALRLPEIGATVVTGIASGRNEMRGAQFAAPPFGSVAGVDFRSQVDRGHAARWTITARQPIYDAARFASARQLGRGATAAGFRFDSAAQQLMQRVAKTYFDLLLAKDRVRVLQAEHEAARTALAMADRQFEAGAIAAVDRNEAAARDDAVAAQLIAAAGEEELARAALRDLSGGEVSDLDLPEFDLNEQALAVGPLEAWIARSDRDNPHLRAQHVAADIAADEVDKYRALGSPRLNLVAQVGEDWLSKGPAEISGRNTLIGVQIDIPLFTGGMRSARLAEAGSLAEAARNDVISVRQGIERQVRSAWLGVTAGLARVRTLVRAERSSQMRLDSTRLGRDIGDRSTLDLLDAQQEYFGTVLELHRARLQVLQSWLDLHAAAGTLDDDRFAVINAQLNRHQR